MELQWKFAYLPLKYKIAFPVGIAKEANRLAELDVYTKVLSPVRELNKVQLGEMEAILIEIDIIYI